MPGNLFASNFVENKSMTTNGEETEYNIFGRYFGFYMREKTCFRFYVQKFRKHFDGKVRDILAHQNANFEFTIDFVECKGMPTEIILSNPEVKKQLKIDQEGEVKLTVDYNWNYKREEKHFIEIEKDFGLLYKFSQKAED